MLNCFLSLCSYFTEPPPHTHTVIRSMLNRFFSLGSYLSLFLSLSHTHTHTQSYMLDAQLFLQFQLIPRRQHTLLHARFSTAFSAIAYTSRRTGSLRAGSGTGERIFSGTAARADWQGETYTNDAENVVRNTAAGRN
jgi:hypothetical protein